MKPVCITFAGPFGSSKSPIAQFLSCQLGWPRFENDVVRTEVREDTLSFDLDTDDYTSRVITRIRDLTSRRQNFIYDASNDRMWLKFLENFEPDAYRIGVVSLDITAEFYKRLIATKQYPLTDEQIKGYLEDHRQFRDKFGDVVICSIDDTNFRRRLEVSLRAAQSFIESA